MRHAFACGRVLLEWPAPLAVVCCAGLGHAHCATPRRAPQPTLPCPWQARLCRLPAAGSRGCGSGCAVLRAALRAGRAAGERAAGAGAAPCGGSALLRCAVLLARPSAQGRCRPPPAVRSGRPCAAAPRPCLPQPSHTGHRFVALTGFFVVYKFFGLPATASMAELERVRPAGMPLCASVAACGAPDCRGRQAAADQHTGAAGCRLSRPPLLARRSLLVPGRAAPYRRSAPSSAARAGRRCRRSGRGS